MEEGSHNAEEEDQLDVYLSLLICKRYCIYFYLYSADLYQRSFGFPSQFWCPIPGHCNSDVNFQHLICQASIGTNFFLILIQDPKHDCRVAVKPSYPFPKRMLLTCGRIRQRLTQAVTHMCCQGVCEVCKFPFFGPRPRFEPLVFEIFYKSRGCPCLDSALFRLGFTAALNPDLDGVCSDSNQRKTWLSVVTPWGSSACVARKCV